MKRLCRQLYVIAHRGHTRVFAPGMVYDVEEFKDGEALVDGIWAPDYIFDLCEVSEMYKQGMN